MNYLIFLVFAFTLLSCRAQQNEKLKNNKRNNEIVDIFYSNPYEIICNNECNITLPDSLGGTNLNGYAGIEIIIDDNSNIIELKVIRLNLVNINTKENFIDFHRLEENVSDYPYYIKRYISFIKMYMNNTIQVKKIGVPNKKNRIILMVRFK